MSNVDIVKEAYNQFANGNLTAVVSNLAPDVQWIKAEKNVTIQGRTRVKNVFKKLEKNYKIFEVVPEKFVEVGDHVIVFSRYKAVYKESNVHIDRPVAQIIKLKNEQVISVKEHISSA